MKTAERVKQALEEAEKQVSLSNGTNLEMHRVCQKDGEVWRSPDRQAVERADK